MVKVLNLAKRVKIIEFDDDDDDDDDDGVFGLKIHGEGSVT